MPALKISSLLLSKALKFGTKSTTAAPTLAPYPLRAPPRCLYIIPAPLNKQIYYYNYNKKQLGFYLRGIEKKRAFYCSSSSPGDMGFEPAQQDNRKKEKLLTLPTMLTIGRVAAVPVLVGTFYVDSWWGTTSTTSIFIIAAITDWLDGYIARRMKLGTAFGAFLDPVADKLMVAATLILLCTRPFEVPIYGQVPWVLTVPAIAIIGREITMSAVREWAASQNGKLSEAVAVNNLGKWKTATQMIALTILLATRDSSLASSGGLVGSGIVLLYISAWLSVWSLFVYMRKIWKVLLK